MIVCLRVVFIVVGLAVCLCRLVFVIIVLHCIVLSFVFMSLIVVYCFAYDICCFNGWSVFEVCWFILFVVFAGVLVLD